MIVTTPLETKTVTDYTFQFANGLSMLLTVDENAGDSVDWATSPLIVIFKLAEKPSPNNSEVKLPAEEISVFLSHVLSISKQNRTITELTPEQKQEWKNTLLKMSKAIN